MTLKIYVTQLEVFDEVDDLIFKLTAFDDACVTVDLCHRAHNVESWAELSQCVQKAIEMMTTEVNPS